jgi:hypothetical protein
VEDREYDRRVVDIVSVLVGLGVLVIVGLTEIIRDNVPDEVWKWVIVEVNDSVRYKVIKVVAVLEGVIVHVTLGVDVCVGVNVIVGVVDFDDDGVHVHVTVVLKERSGVLDIVDVSVFDGVTVMVGEIVTDDVVVCVRVL